MQNGLEGDELLENIRLDHCSTISVSGRALLKSNHLRLIDSWIRDTPLSKLSYIYIRIIYW